MIMNGYLEKDVHFEVHIRSKAHTFHHRLLSIDTARHIFKHCSRQYDWVMLNMYNKGKFLQTLDATPAVMKGEDPDKPEKVGTDYAHTGFCMGTFNTAKCYDCPTVRDCLKMYGKDQAVLAVKRVVDRMIIEGLISGS